LEENEENVSRVRTISMDNGTISDDNQKLRTTNTELETMVSGLRDRNENLTQQMASLQREIDGKVEEISLLRTENSKLKGELSRVTMELEFSKKISENFEQQLAQQESVLITVREENDRTKEDVREVSTRLQNTSSENIFLASKSENLYKEKSKLSDKLTQMERRLLEITAERNMLRSNYSAQLREQNQHFEVEKRKSTMLLIQLQDTSETSKQMELTRVQMEEKIKGIEALKEEELSAVRTEGDDRLVSLMRERQELQYQLRLAQQTQEEYRLQYELQMKEVESQVARWNATILAAHTQKEARYSAEVKRLQNELSQTHDDQIDVYEFLREAGNTHSTYQSETSSMTETVSTFATAQSNTTSTTARKKRTRKGLWPVLRK